MKIVGDLVIGGRIYPSDNGVAQTDKYIYYDSSGKKDGYMRTNAAGWATGSYDFAEMFPSKDALEPGDVVVFGTEKEELVKSTKKSDTRIAGVVSTRPGFVAGENTPGSFPIALSGRVPTKVSVENGIIAVGDPLTTSSSTGVAMKATEAGPIVGYALEVFGGQTSADFDKILVFINPGYWGGELVSSAPGTQNTASFIGSGNNSNFTSLNMEGNVYMAGNSILNVSRIVGLGEKWSIDEEGTIQTAGLVKNVITSYQNEKVEVVAVMNPEVMITLTGTGTLQNGQASVNFEQVSPSFNDVTSTFAPVRVLVTPNGPISLYVTSKSNNGFSVAQVGGMDSGTEFDWMVTAYRKDYEPKLAEPAVSDEEAKVEDSATEPIIDESVAESSPVIEQVPVLETEPESAPEVSNLEPIEEIADESVIESSPVI